MMKATSVRLAVALATLQLVRTGNSLPGEVCEEARIPLRTLHLADGNSVVCVVPFCGGQEKKMTPEGGETCMTCDNSPWGVGEVRPKSDVCPTSLGECTDGYCCPLEGKDTWYHQNFGVDWKGMNTFPGITVTTYGGSAACGGTVEQAVDYVNQFGIDGVAAVPSQMYGSYYVWSSALNKSWPQSQQCYRNNNICYRVKAQDDQEYLIAVWGKCGGYVQCTGSNAEEGGNKMSEKVSRVDGSKWNDANMCITGINGDGIGIAAGTTPDCLAMRKDGEQVEGLNCCSHVCSEHVDWCGSNDHVHFDINEVLYRKICPDLNPCSLKWAKAELCPWNPPKDEAGPDAFIPKFEEAAEPNSAEVKSLHAPYDEPTCGAYRPTSAPTEEPPKPTEEPPKPTEEPPEVDCSEVTMAACGATLSADCSKEFCSALCSSAKTADCSSSKCVEEKISTSWGSKCCSFA